MSASEEEGKIYQEFMVEGQKALDLMREKLESHRTLLIQKFGLVARSQTGDAITVYSEAQARELGLEHEKVGGDGDAQNQAVNIIFLYDLVICGVPFEFELHGPGKAH